MRPNKVHSRRRFPPRLVARLSDPAAICSRRVWDNGVERIPLMNPDTIQSALPVVSSDVSLIALFLQAAWIVMVVMLGLLVCLVWDWAIAFDILLLYLLTLRVMDII